MAASGIEFGSHTVSHPILWQLTHEELERELRDSRRSFGGGQPVDVIAYPIGETLRVRRAGQGSLQGLQLSP